MTIEMPAEGGSYQRDPRTGKLKRLGDESGAAEAVAESRKDNDGKETGK